MDQSSSPVLPNETPTKKTNPWIIVLIIVIVLVVLCCLCVIVVVVLVPALLGPSVGNVFSSIQQELITPVP
jgi:flagellar basal body-associated protein FliL